MASKQQESESHPTNTQIAAAVRAKRSGQATPKLNEASFKALVTAIAAASNNNLLDTHFFVLQIGAHVGNTPNDPVFRHLVGEPGDSQNSSPAAGKQPPWHALLVEPLPHLVQQLQANYRSAAAQGRVQFAAVAVCDEAGSQPFYHVAPNTAEAGVRAAAESDAVSPTQLGSLLQATVSRAAIPDGYTVVTSHVQCFTLRQLLQQYRVAAASVDYLQVDCEGYDWRIVRTAVREVGLHPALVRMESKHLDDTDMAAAWRELTQVHGYRCAELGSEDTVCVDVAMLHRVGSGPWQPAFES